MADQITLPRSVVAQLVDNSERVYLYGDYDDGYFCLYCHEEQVTLIDHNCGYDHTPDCPVRLAQEALASEPEDWLRATLTALAQEMRISGSDRVAEYGWRLTRLLED